MKKFFNNIRKYHKYMYKNAISELKSEVSGSYLSWLWWFIEPAAFMAIYAIVFGIMFGNDEKYLLVFILLGLSSWQFFSRMITCSVKLIPQNRELLTKVYIPKYILLISKSYVYLFKMGISLFLAVILMIITKVPFTIFNLYILILIPFLYLITFGFCIIIMHYGVYLGDLNKLLDIILKLVFYMSGIFYSIEDRISANLAEYVLNLNPVAISINEFRNVMIYGVHPSVLSLLIWSVISLVLIIIGVSIIHKNENNYAKVV